MSTKPLSLCLSGSIRSKRESLGLSQEVFADEIGMHRTYYSAIERGEKNITVSTLERLAKGLGVKPSALFLDVGA